MDPNKILQIATTVVTVASILANFIPAHTWVGKPLHWIALNVRLQPPTPPPAQ